MSCRIGMSTNVPERERHWGHKARIIASGLTYDEATAREKSERSACGTHCQGDVGGPRKAERVYSVYRMDW